MYIDTLFLVEWNHLTHCDKKSQSNDESWSNLRQQLFQSGETQVTRWPSNSDVGMIHSGFMLETSSQNPAGVDQPLKKQSTRMFKVPI